MLGESWATGGKSGLWGKLVESWDAWWKLGYWEKVRMQWEAGVLGGSWDAGDMQAPTAHYEMWESSAQKDVVFAPWKAVREEESPVAVGSGPCPGCRSGLMRSLSTAPGAESLSPFLTADGSTALSQSLRKSNVEDLP